MKVRIKSMQRIANTCVFIPKNTVLEVEEIIGSYYVVAYFNEKDKGTYYPTIFKGNCEVVEQDNKLRKSREVKIAVNNNGLIDLENNSSETNDDVWKIYTLEQEQDNEIYKN